MKTFVMIGTVALVAGSLFAQQTETQTTTTTAKTFNGTLLDAGCYTKQIAQRKESKTDETGSTTTKTETTTTTECPVTTTTTNFGVLQPSGEFVRFDQPSSERVVEMVRKHHKWNEYISERKPIPVRVVAMPNGDFVVVREIQ